MFGIARAPGADHPAMHWRGVIPLMVLLLLSPPLYAREPGWYVGAGAGPGHADVPASFWIDSSGTTGTADNTTLGFEAYAGYPLWRHLALEFAYLDFGRTEFDGRTDGVLSRWNPGPIRGTANISGISVQAMAPWSMGNDRFTVFLKGGVLWFTTATRYDSNINDINRFNDDGANFIGGGGVEWRVWHDWRLRGEWQVTSVQLENKANAAVQLLTLGISHPIP